MTTHLLGYPRIGAQRELKFALERYWRGELTEAALRQLGVQLRRQHWRQQADAGVELLPVGDFAWYDHVLQTSLMLGNAPARHQHPHTEYDLELLFRIARGQGQQQACCGGSASEMTKWFNTNYHYLVPEFEQGQQFALRWFELFDQVQEAQALGHQVKPVLLGPLTYLWLGKTVGEPFDRLTLLPQLLTVYQQICARLLALGVEWIQIDEPILVLDLPEPWQQAFKHAYQQLDAAPNLILTSYFGSVADKIDWLVELPVGGIHLDLCAAPEQIQSVVGKVPDSWVLSLGVVNGRNIWRADLSTWLTTLQRLRHQRKARLWLGTSCSLQHVPVDVALESQLPAGLGERLAFAVQKCEELSLLQQAVAGGEEATRRALKNRPGQVVDFKLALRQRLAALTDADVNRATPFAQRYLVQAEALGLPPLPTTTIGSFPQTPELRQARAAFRRAEISAEVYQQHLQAYIDDAVARQEAAGLDVLVHGEPERNDMVEYFGELLDGVATTAQGWVQSYGSRCVKPPIIYADVEAPAPMTVDWTRYAQAQTEKPVKGMLTGPITLLNWSFVREDLPRADVALQLGWAVRQETLALEQAGVKVIQIDEPALREGLPLRQTQQGAYLDWAVRAFKLASSAVAETTQIHTHMCYSEFGAILPAIAALDADVITIETARAEMALLQQFNQIGYTNAVGPGIYDIHSPVVPDAELLRQRVEHAQQQVPVQRLWVNPDCGLKTRTWTETQPALLAMVNAAKAARAALSA